MPPDHPVATTPNTLDERVAAAQARLVFDRTRLANLAGLPLSALVLALLWSHQPQWLLSGWVAAKAAVSLWRATLDMAQRQAATGTMPRRLRQLQWALLADGLLYGAIGTLLLPAHDTTLAVTLVAITMCVAAVAAVVMNHHFGALMAFVAPLILPLAVSQLARGQLQGLYLGIGSLMFMLLVLVEGWRSSRDTRASLRTRFFRDDLSAQREAALALAQHHSAAKSRFLTTMSHEMRTPLHGMLGVARLLQSGAGDSTTPDLRSRLATLEHSGERLLSLIDDVLDYSRLEGGELALSPASFDLVVVLAEVGATAQQAAHAKGLTARLESALVPPCWVHGDAGRLRQVLHKLVDNAVKFTDHGGLTLQCRRSPDGLVLIDVIDTGSGIGPDEAKRIFDAFHQTDDSNQRRHGGTGLGLALASALTRLMGGELGCHGRPGAGAHLWLRLPLPSAAAPATAPPASLPARRPGAPAAQPPRLQGRVLLVEDNAVNAMVAEAMLLRTGVQVEVVDDGEQAVLHCRRQRPDLVLMDCQMPVLDGIAATQCIRADERAAGLTPLVIIGLTANATDSDRQQCLAAGMDDYLSKPFREQHLHQLLARHLDPAGTDLEARPPAPRPPGTASGARLADFWHNPG